MDNLATVPQKRKFFALCNELGYDGDQMKERAKTKFKLDSFSKITKEQMSWLIDQLLIKLNKTIS